VTPILRRLLPVFLCGLLAACSLPRGAALQSEILSDGDSGANFQLVVVTREMLPELRDWPAAAGIHPTHHWIPHHRGPSSPVILSGDMIHLSVWDSEENSLLTAPAQMVVDINDLNVTPQGTIFVPYLDEVVVAGATPDAARRRIQESFTAIIPSAQVQLKVTPGQKNLVDLVGGVARPGAYPLPDRDYSILSLLSAGGGIPPGMRNPQVRLIRDGRIFGVSAARLLSDPSLDTTLRGGDKVIVEEDERYFLALGATGNEELVYFEKDELSALDVLSIVGGVSDRRANPQGVLILREYPPEAIEVDRPGPFHERVIFSLDLTSADGLFSARKFLVRSGDVVLATESPVTALETVLGLFGTALGSVTRVSNIGN
jgi:polysaccharide export outer membrane protein